MAQPLITSFTVNSVAPQGSSVLVIVTFNPTGDQFSMVFDGDATSSYMSDMFKSEAMKRNRAASASNNLQSVIGAVVAVP